MSNLEDTARSAPPEAPLSTVDPATEAELTAARQDAREELLADVLETIRRYPSSFSASEVAEDLRGLGKTVSTPEVLEIFAELEGQTRLVGVTGGGPAPEDKQYQEVGTDAEGVSFYDV